MPVVVDFSADQKLRQQSKRDCAGQTERRFFFPGPIRDLRRLGLVDEVHGRVKPVLHQLGIRHDLCLELVVLHRSAARLVERAIVRLERGCNGDRRIRAIQHEVSDLAEKAGWPERASVVEIGHVANVMAGCKRSKLELDVLVRRVFELELGFGGGVTAIALAKPAGRVDRNFLLAFKADAGALGEAEDVLGLDLVKLHRHRRAFLRNGRDSAAEQDGQNAQWRSNDPRARSSTPHRPRPLSRVNSPGTLCAAHDTFQIIRCFDS